MVLNKNRFVLGTYLFIALVAVPLLAPLRQLQVFSPALVLIGSIPLIVLLIILILGHRLLVIRSYMSLALIFSFLQAALVGSGNLLEGDGRYYFSHLFQLFSAFVMIVAGAQWSDDFGEKFWRRFAMMALFAASASTLMSLRAWYEGDIGRYYTPAYILIFVSAFSLAVRPKGGSLTIVSVLVAIVSNKRGPLLSVAIMILTYLSARLFFRQRSFFRYNKQSLIMLFVIITASPVAVIVAPSLSVFDDNIVIRAYEQTTDRLLSIVRDNPEEIDLNAYSAGRIKEIELGLETLNGSALLIGNGAGSTIALNSERSIQNIHFTPLSLTVVYGLPFAIFIYIYSILLIIRNMRLCLSSGTVTEKMAILYLTGSLLHTMFAYSIFIDLLNFFFIGVLVNVGSRQCKNRYNKNNFNTLQRLN